MSHQPLITAAREWAAAVKAAEAHRRGAWPNPGPHNYAVCQARRPYYTLPEPGPDGAVCAQTPCEVCATTNWDAHALDQRNLAHKAKRAETKLLRAIAELES